MKTLKSIFALAIISLTILSSCGKYEEGPKISLRSKKARLCGDWTIEKATYDGTDITSFVSGMTLDIEKDGGYKMKLGSQQEEGKWKLGEDKDDVMFTRDTTGAKEESYRILMLKNKEMQLRSTNTQGKYTVYEYKQ